MADMARATGVLQWLPLALKAIDLSTQSPQSPLPNPPFSIIFPTVPYCYYFLCGSSSSYSFASFLPQCNWAGDLGVGLNFLYRAALIASAYVML